MNRKLKARIFEQFGTQGDFAQAMGISQTKISRVIRGKAVLRPGEQRKWAGALDCERRQIFGPMVLSKGLKIWPHKK